MRKIKFGIIGCGLMGKEFASAAARWMHLSTDIAIPEIVAVCDINPKTMDWFSKNVSTVKLITSDYRELLALKEIEAVYCAVPHNMHEQLYTDIINAKKHLLGEKPFGIDINANKAIMKAINENPEILVRCASQFPFYPACQELVRWVEEGKLGKIIGVKAGFSHSSDINPDKPINWKREIETNGEYGCMGDLGIHTQHVPFRLGFIPRDVYAVLSKIINERPDGKGNMVPCLTWDNATLICRAENELGEFFPMTFEMNRIMPGDTNNWELEIYGLSCSVRFTTNDTNAFYYTQVHNKEQAWCRVAIGNKPIFPTITGEIFEFGFSDAILQMWASFIMEIEGKEVRFKCFTPEETVLSHKLLSAALESEKSKSVVEI